VVCQNDPDTFRAAYGLPPDAMVFGPYTGMLENHGESVRLERPDNPEDTGFVPYVRVDHVNYDDEAPWPQRAAGAGSPLNRIAPNGYGNDVGNWGDGRFGGTPDAQNASIDTSPPTVPTGVQAVAVNSSRIDLTWPASDDQETAVVCYTVYRNGVEIGSSPTATSASCQARRIHTRCRPPTPTGTPAPCRPRRWPSACSRSTPSRP
jgi:hypothetical protein